MKKIITTTVLLIFISVFLPHLPGASDKPGVVFYSPKSGETWVGDLEIRFHLRNIDPQSVRGVELYLDGQLIKTFDSPPYRYTFAFGAHGEYRELRVLVKGEKFGTLASASLHSLSVDATHEVEVTQVVVPVVVNDYNGNYIRGLKQEDFQLLVDGKPQEISYVRSSGATDFNMAVLVDISASMRFKIRDVLEAAGDFLKNLMGPNDRGVFVFFNEEVFDPTGLTGDKKELEEGLKMEAPPMGDTALYDAVAYTLNLMGSRKGWNIMVIFSDGEDNSSYIDPMSLVQKVKKSNTVIYAIKNIPGDDGHRYYSIFLQNICQYSGGMTFNLLDVKTTRQVYDRIREDIKAQYLLHFAPSQKGKPGIRKRFHSITVQIKNKDYTIRTLKGFHY